jgi:hypothetical protein
VADLPVEIAAMPIRPVDHRRNGDHRSAEIGLFPLVYWVFRCWHLSRFLSFYRFNDHF